MRLRLLESLVTPHGLDRYLELVNPMLVRGEIRGAVTAVRHQTADTVTITLRPSSAWRGFTAGQFVRLSVDIDGVRRTRCYSPACSQHRSDGQIEFTVKAHADGTVSPFLQGIRPGAVVGLAPADGTFTLPEPRPHRIVLISGGSGITPVMSMARTLRDEGHQGPIVFLHYANSEQDALYQNELAELTGVRPQLVCTERDGFFSREHLPSWYADADTFLCGPPGLMAAVREVFDADGLLSSLHSESFTPPAPAAGAAGGRITFARSGAGCDNSGKTLLEQAETAGLRPVHGCRMGICFSCTQTKNTGQVRDVRTGELHGEDGEQIQLCVSVPVGDVELNL